MEVSPYEGEKVPEGAEKVNEADRAFYQALSNGDLEAMSRVWSQANYVSAIHPDFPVPFLGPKNVKTGWEQMFANNRDIHVHARAKNVYVSGDLAWVIDATEFEAVGTKTSEPIHMDNVLTTKIFERKGDEWMLVHYHAHRGPSLSHAH